jgi:hypothetical protein
MAVNTPKTIVMSTLVQSSFLESDGVLSRYTNLTRGKRCKIAAAPPAIKEPYSQPKNRLEEKKSLTKAFHAS